MGFLPRTQVCELDKAIDEAFKAVARATAVPRPNQQPGSFGTGILDVGALVNAPLPPATSLQRERPA